MASELTFPRNITLEWFQSTLRISDNLLQSLMQDMQDALRNSGIPETSRLNTKDIKTRVETQVLPQIKEAHTSIFEPFSDVSVRRCLWYIALRVQSSTRRPTTQGSQSFAPSNMAKASSTSTAMLSTSAEISLRDVLIRLLHTETNVATIVSPRDLVANGDPVIENVMYERLEDIAVTDLAFDKARYNIVFSDPDGTDYILCNDRNLRTAFLSISQSKCNSTNRKGVFKIEPRGGSTKLNKALGENEAENSVPRYQFPLAERFSVPSSNRSLSHSTRGSKGRPPYTSKVASGRTKRREVHEESDSSYERSQAEESVAEETDGSMIEQRWHELLEAPGKGGNGCISNIHEASGRPSKRLRVRGESDKPYEQSQVERSLVEETSVGVNEEMWHELLETPTRSRKDHTSDMPQVASQRRGHEESDGTNVQSQAEEGLAKEMNMDVAKERQHELLETLAEGGKTRPSDMRNITNQRRVHKELGNPNLQSQTNVDVAGGGGHELLEMPIEGGQILSSDMRSVTGRHSESGRVHEELDGPHELIQSEDVVAKGTVANIAKERQHEPLEGLDERLQYNQATEPTKFGEPNKEWDEYEENRLLSVNEDPSYHLGENLPTIEDQFTRLTDLKACEQLNQESWIICCRFWKRDPKITDRDIGVPLEPLKVPLRPYQAFAVWWMLKRERTAAGGGIVADEMGLGKTLEVLAHRIINAWLVIAKQEIATDRAVETANSKRHLPENHTPNDRCPTEPFPFACPCSQWSASHNIKPIYSAALIISPKGLLTTWLNEFCRHVDHQHPMGKRLKMWIAHCEGSSLNGNLSKSYGKLKLSPSIDDLQILRRDRRNNRARSGAHFVTVLTTSGSYRSQLSDRIRFEIKPTLFNQRKRMIQRAETEPDLQWGLIYRDEFHKERKQSSGTPTLIREINESHENWKYPTLWFLSGTPFEKGPSDLVAYIALLETEGWLTRQKYKMYTSDKVADMGKVFERLVKQQHGSKKDRQDFIFRFSDLLALFMIRRTSQTEWFGQELVKLPPHESRDIRCALDAKYATIFQEFQAQIRAKVEREFVANMQRWKASGSRGNAPTLVVKNLVGASYKARICATFPYLTNLLARNTVDLTWSQIVDKKWHLDPKESPYFRDLDAIIESSRKIVEIEKILNDLKTDIHGKPEKLVILSIAPTVAFILFLWLKDIKGYDAALFHSQLSLSERSDIKTSFQEDVDYDTGREAFLFYPRILVGTVEVLGIGHQLTRAFRIILTEPDHSFSNEYQAIKRINRIGQENRKTYSYRLYCEESEVEMLIVKRQDARKALHDAVLATKQDSN